MTKESFRKLSSFLGSLIFSISITKITHPIVVVEIKSQIFGPIEKMMNKKKKKKRFGSAIISFKLKEKKMNYIDLKKKKKIVHTRIYQNARNYLRI